MLLTKLFRRVGIKKRMNFTPYNFRHRDNTVGCVAD